MNNETDTERWRGRVDAKLDELARRLDGNDDDTSQVKANVERIGRQIESMSTRLAIASALVAAVVGALSLALASKFIH